MKYQTADGSKIEVEVIQGKQHITSVDVGAITGRMTTEVNGTKYQFIVSDDKQTVRAYSVTDGELDLGFPFEFIKVGPSILEAMEMLNKEAVSLVEGYTLADIPEGHIAEVCGGRLVIVEVNNIGNYQSLVDGEYHDIFEEIREMI